MGARTEYNREWRKSHPELMKASRDRWRKSHPEKIKEYNHRQYERRKALRQEQKGSGEDG